MTMIEKMARAIQGAGFPAERMSDADADDCARAALMEMLEPNNAICEAGAEALEITRHMGPAFTAMIDAILAGKE